MENKKITVLIILGIAAVFSLVYGIVTPPKAKTKPRISKEHMSTAVKADIDIVYGGRKAKRTGFSGWPRDPFSSGPAAFLSANISDMMLTGILWDDTAPLAMINDNPVGVGDEVGAYIVVEIKKDRVILMSDNKNYEIRLAP